MGRVTVPVMTDLPLSIGQVSFFAVVLQAYFNPFKEDMDDLLQVWALSVTALPSTTDSFGRTLLRLCCHGRMAAAKHYCGQIDLCYQRPMRLSRASNIFMLSLTFRIYLCSQNTLCNRWEIVMKREERARTFR